MAWTAPKTYVALSVLTAAELNTYERDNLLFLYTVLANIKTTTITGAVSTTSTSFTDLTGLTQAITPTASSHKVLVQVATSVSHSALELISMNVVRTSTAIGQPSGGSTPATAQNTTQASTDIKALSMIVEDSPATTSATTYKIQWKVSGGTGYVNRRGDSANITSVSTINLREVIA